MSNHTLEAVRRLLRSRVTRVYPDQRVVRDLCAVARPGAVRLLVEMFDAPVEALLGLKEPAYVLGEAAARHVGGDPAAIREALDEVFRALERRVRRYRQAQLDKHPFTFHLHAFRDAAKRGRLDLYRALALPAQCALRRVEEEFHRPDLGKPGAPETLYRYALALRIFLLHVRAGDVHLVAPGMAMPEKVVRDAFAAAWASPGESGPEDWDRTHRDHYSRCLYALCGVGDPRRTRQPGFGRLALRRLGRGRSETYYCEKGPEGEAVICFASNLPDWDEGESPWDRALLLDVWRGRPTWMGSRRAQVPTLWSAGVVHPGEIAVLYRGLCPASPDELSTPLLAAALVSLAVLHLGLDPESFVASLWQQDASGEKAPLSLDPEALTVAHEIPRALLAAPRPSQAEVCLPGDPRVRLPLPPMLRAIVRECVRRGLHLLGGLRAGDLDGHLRALSPRLSLRTLRNTFEPLYRWAGLDPVLVALVSGGFPFRVRSAIAYTNISAAELARRYWAAHRVIQDAVLAHLEPGARPWWADGAEPVPAIDGRIGSSLVPDPARVREYMRTLRARLEELTRQAASSGTPLEVLVRAHNLHAAYCHLAVLWALVVRPRRQPAVGDDALAAPWVAVRDKDSPTFRESRPGPLARRLEELLRSFDRGHRALRYRLACEGRPVEGEADGLLVVIRRSWARALTSEGLRAVLETEGLPYPWAFNGARHSWHSLLLGRGYLARFEALLGHVHEGLEPWGWHSLADLRDRGQAFRQLAEEVLDMIDLRPMPHPCDPRQ